MNIDLCTINEWRNAEISTTNLINAALLSGQSSEIHTAISVKNRLMLALNRLWHENSCSTQSELGSDNDQYMRLFASNAAAVLEEPIWGQFGVFEIEVDGIKSLVALSPVDGEHVWMHFYCPHGQTIYAPETGKFKVNYVFVVTGQSVKAKAEELFKMKLSADLPVTVSKAYTPSEVAKEVLGDAYFFLEKDYEKI